MKSKKGFTLIELLAIIVILAIIAVITVPIILNIIENSRKGAATDSAYGYKDAVNKWYLEKLSLDHNFNLNSSYTITNGNLGNETISVSGDKPTSGYLNYTNNVLTTGCLVFGDYAVTFTNGEVTSTVKGTCNNTPTETVSYFTYDMNATPNAIGYKNSTKVPEIDPSWSFYIKEITQEGVTSYAIEITVGSETMVGEGYDTEEECESYLTFWSSQLNGMNLQCVELDNKVSHELYGVESGTTFMLKAHDFENSIDTLNDVFKCNATTSDPMPYCDGETVTATAVAESGDVGIMIGNTRSCVINGFGLAGCTVRE